MNGARSGDTLVLESGARYVANIELPPNDGPEYITMTSDANVPPRARACPEPARAARHHPVAERVPGGAGANGRELLPVRRSRVPWRRRRRHGIDTTRDIVSVGDGTETDAALLPSHFVFDRVLIRGDATYGAKRGILGNGHDITLEYSDIRTIFRNGQDTSGFGCYNCGKTYRINHNWIEAGTEVILFGGAASPAHTVAEDIIIEDNVLTRPLAWKALAGPPNRITSVPASIQLC